MFLKISQYSQKNTCVGPATALGLQRYKKRVSDIAKNTFLQYTSERVLPKEHSQDKANQKSLPQLKKYFSSFIKMEKNSEQKVLENQKTKNVKEEVV